MPTTLPSLTETIDQTFVSTWYEIREDAIDNILGALVVWMALEEAGCFTNQVGGRYIERTIKYANQAAVAVGANSELPIGTPQLETAALWTRRYIATHVQRNTIEDSENAGPERIKSLVSTRLADAREGMRQKMESAVLATEVTAETGLEMQGLNDILPAYASLTGAITYGKITRPVTYSNSGNGVYKPTTATATNPWWGPAYLQLPTPYAVNLLSYMTKLFNTLFNNQEAPNLLISDQNLYDLYEEFAIDASQIIKEEGTKLVDLGFSAMRFKGQRWIWTPNYTANEMGMFNTNYIEVVRDPNLWFDMTEWKAVPRQFDRIAHIVACATTITTQMRRHGRLTVATVS